MIVAGGQWGWKPRSRAVTMLTCRIEIWTLVKQNQCLALGQRDQIALTSSLQGLLTAASKSCHSGKMELTEMNNQSHDLAVAKAITTAGTTTDAVGDTGRVRVGGGMLRFAAGATPDAVKDTGRVRVGGGMLRL